MLTNFIAAFINKPTSKDASDRCRSLRKSDRGELSGVFPKWKRNSVNSANYENLTNHWNVNWGQFKEHRSYLCLAGTVLAYLSLTQEVAGSSHPFYKTIVTEFSGNFQGKVRWWNWRGTLQWFIPNYCLLGTEIRTLRSPIPLVWCTSALWCMEQGPGTGPESK